MSTGVDRTPLIANWRSKDQTVTKLPRGNHRISHEEVRASQSGRIMRSTLELIGRVGPGPISISEISRGAKVSRKTFYSLFDSYEDCLRQSVMTAHLVLGTEMAMAVERADLGGEWPRLTAMVDEFISMAAEEPLIAAAVIGNGFAIGNGTAPIWMQVREAQRGILAGYWREDRVSMGLPPAGEPGKGQLVAAVAVIECSILEALASGSEHELTGQVDDTVAEVIRILGGQE